MTLNMKRLTISEPRQVTRQEMDRLDIEAARAALAEARTKGTISFASAKKRLGF
jgi:hypothetical protein